MDWLSGKKGWMFVVKATERCLVEVDKKWRHKHWRWHRVKGVGSDFLGGYLCPSDAGDKFGYEGRGGGSRGAGV